MDKDSIVQIVAILATAAVCITAFIVDTSAGLLTVGAVALVVLFA